MTETSYVHGYSDRESRRLLVQANSVSDLVHADLAYPSGSRVLEVGCGTGAQTLMLARKSPGAHIVSFDQSWASLAEARAKVRAANLENVEFRQADVFALPFDERAFDHVFVCFVLEHLPNPLAALNGLRRVLKRGGTMTVFEGDHGSTYFHPHSAVAQRVIACQAEIQRRCGGNALIGRELFPLLVEAGYSAPHVSPRVVYIDGSRPDLLDAYVRKTFTPMIEDVRDSAIDAGIIDAASFDAGIRALHRTAERDGVFCYTFFKGTGKA